MLHRTMLALAALLSLSLSGCFLVRSHQIDVQQGNVITPAAIQQLKTGMSKDQVISLLGAPVLSQTANNQLSYAYTWESNHKPMQLQKLVIYFSNGKLSHYSSNVQAPQKHF